MGEQTAIEGDVVHAAYRPLTNSQPTFLNFESATEGFYVVIFGADRARFDVPPDTAFEGERVCVTGEMEEYRGRPQIIVSSPEQIELASEDDVTPDPPSQREGSPSVDEEPSARPASAAVSEIPATIRAYFGAINAERYEEAWRLLSTDRQARSDGGFAGFAEGHSTTSVSDVSVRTVTELEDGVAVAWVTFTSRQAAWHGPQRQVCTHWTLDYYMLAEETRWLIDRSRGHAGGSEGESC